MGRYHRYPDPVEALHAAIHQTRTIPVPTLEDCMQGRSCWGPKRDCVPGVNRLYKAWQENLKVLEEGRKGA